MASGTINKYADGTDTTWVPIEDASYVSSPIYIRKIGSIVNIYATNLRLATDLSDKLYRTLGTKLLKDYAPSGIVSIWAGSLTKMGQIRISNDGSVNFFRPSAAETWKGGTNGDAITFSATYMIG